MNEIETWAYINDDGDVALFPSKPHTTFGEEDLKKVHTPTWPFTLEEEELAVAGPGFRGYYIVPADHKVAKYVREHGVEV